MSLRRVHCVYGNRRILLVIGEEWNLDDFKYQILVEFELESECLDDYVLLLKGSEIRSIMGIFCDDVVELKKVLNGNSTASTNPENFAAPGARETGAPRMTSESPTTVTNRSKNISTSSLGFAAPGRLTARGSALGVAERSQSDPRPKPAVLYHSKTPSHMNASKKRKFSEAKDANQADEPSFTTKRVKLDSEAQAEIIVEDSDDEQDIGFDRTEMLQLKRYDPKEIESVNGVSSTRKRAEAALELLLKKGWVELKGDSSDKIPWVAYIELVIKRHEDKQSADWAKNGPGPKYVNVSLMHLLRACGVAECHDSSIRLGFVSISAVPRLPLELSKKPRQVFQDDSAADEETSSSFDSSPSASPEDKAPRSGLLFGYSAKDMEELNKIADLKQRAERIMQHFESKQWFSASRLSCDRSACVEFVQYVLFVCSGPKVRDLSRSSLCRTYKKLAGTTERQRNLLVVLLESTRLLGGVVLSRTYSPVPYASGYVDTTHIDMKIAPKFQKLAPPLSDHVAAVKNEDSLDPHSQADGEAASYHRNQSPLQDSSPSELVGVNFVDEIDFMNE